MVTILDDAKRAEKCNEIEKNTRGGGGILVAGGFGERGVLGKMQAIKFARENKIPYLGICLGMQLALIEFARDVLGLEDANSMEFNKECKNPIIYLIDSFIDAHGKKQIRTHTSPLGGTMRLGAYDCDIKPKTLLAEIYGNAEVYGEAQIYGSAKISNREDYIVFKNSWSSGRYFTYTRSNKMWQVGCFYGTGEELVKKAYEDSELSGKNYSLYVELVKNLEKNLENNN